MKLPDPAARNKPREVELGIHCHGAHSAGEMDWIGAAHPDDTAPDEVSENLMKASSSEEQTDGLHMQLPQDKRKNACTEDAMLTEEKMLSYQHQELAEQEESQSLIGLANFEETGEEVDGNSMDQQFTDDDCTNECIADWEAKDALLVKTVESVWQQQIPLDHISNLGMDADPLVADGSQVDSHDCGDMNSSSEYQQSLLLQISHPQHYLRAFENQQLMLETTC